MDFVPLPADCCCNIRIVVGLIAEEGYICRISAYTNGMLLLSGAPVDACRKGKASKGSPAK